MGGCALSLDSLEHQAGLGLPIARRNEAITSMHNSSPGRQIGGASVKRLALAEESQRPDVSVEDVHDVDAEGELEECFEDYEIYDRWGGCSSG